MSVESFLQQIVLRSALHRKPRDILVAQVAQDQDRDVGRCARQLVEGRDSLAIGQEKIDHDRRDFLPSLIAQAFDRVAAATHPLDFEGDRKSTRLNSSHVEISYAVFCLKKKKEI